MSSRRRPSRTEPNSKQLIDYIRAPESGVGVLLTSMSGKPLIELVAPRLSENDGTDAMDIAKINEKLLRFKPNLDPDLAISQSRRSFAIPLVSGSREEIDGILDQLEKVDFRFSERSRHRIHEALDNYLGKSRDRACGENANIPSQKNDFRGA